MSSGTIACLCGAIDIPLTGKLPAISELCHCNACRHTSGALFTGWCSLDESPDATTLSKCAPFASSHTHTRYFCSICGTKAFIQAHSRSPSAATDRWLAFAGVVDVPPGLDNVLDIQSHCWLADTSDGGMAAFMKTLNGKHIQLYNMENSELSAQDLDNMGKTVEFHQSFDLDASLKAECRCGGISLRIQRANHEDHSIPHLDRFVPKDGDGKSTDKHMAFCCVCRFCRKMSGVPLTPWTYIPGAQILNAHTGKPVAQHHEASTPLGKEANSGLSLKHFWTSENACWSFCSTCGASVFYSAATRPEIINVAAGLLRADEGVMARRWLSWQWGRTAWKDETTQKDVMEAWRATANE